MFKGFAQRSSRLHRFTSTILVALSLSFTPAMVSATCFEPSPLIPRGADPYTELNATQLSSGQRNTINKFLRSLRGRWLGTARGYFCSGTVRSPKQVSDNASLTINFDTNGRDKVVMNATLTASGKRVTRSERLQLILGASSLRVNGDNAASEVQLLSASGSSIAFAIKNQRTRGNGSRGLAEVHRYISVSATQLSIEFVVYSQGGLSSSSRWTARKR
jgi:hypothetical protein